MTARATVLIVDDDPAAIQVLFGALEGTAHVRFATSGPEALAMMADAPADVVLLDACMPGMDGFETCRALLRDHPEVPVIFITAASDLVHELRALEAGAVDFISKPINPPIVRARVGVQRTLKEQRDLLLEREAGVRAALVENQRLVAHLQQALDEVKTLSGFLPVCMYCKKVRDDQGFWERLETYLTARTGALVSHGLCPDCERRLCEAEGLELGPPETSPPGEAPSAGGGPAPPDGSAARREALTRAFRVTVHGEGPRTLVCVNGFGTAQGVWGPLVARLGDRFRLLTFDPAGSTPATLGAYRARRHHRLFGFAEDLVRIVEGLDLEGATLVGHSLGAMVGLLAARAVPGLFHRSVLISASARYLDDPERGYVGGFSEADVQRSLACLRGDPAALADGLLDPGLDAGDDSRFAATFLQGLKELRPEIAQAVLCCLLRSDHREDARLYRRLGIPTLLLQTRRDSAVPLQAAEWLAAATGGELRVVDAVGHLPHLAAPDAVAREILAFLEGR